MATGLDYTYRYLAASTLSQGPSEASLSLSLATSGGAGEHPYFFQGSLRYPRLTALCLKTLSRVVAARYHVPAAMLERILRESDPVVTCGGERLRFEGFSGCCGVYARVDLNPDAYQGVLVLQGTTNVDFNSAMLGALGQIRDGECVSLAVGTDEVALLRGTEQVVERKVTLPVRWVRGFAEVQAYLARMERVFTIKRIEAIRFWRSLPASPGNQTPYYVVAAGAGLRLSNQPTGRSIKVLGLVRLRVAESLALACDSVRVYTDASGETSAWEFLLGPLRFTLVLSPETWRGFSGEGQLLEALARQEDDALFNQARASLQWQASLPVEEFAENWDVSVERVKETLQRLAAQGLVGYELEAGAYFHRELPFALDKAERLNPRLKNARKIASTEGVQIVSRHKDQIEAYVRGSGVEHRVRQVKGAWKCTCPWHAKHQGQRGPCKHILAVQMSVTGDKP